MTNTKVQKSKIYYIYKITHTPTGRYYIGQRKLPKHLCDWTQDTYSGSGSVWKKIYNAHPPEEFVKEVKMLADTQDEINHFERVWIGNLYETDPLCCNLRAGGDAPGMSDETRAKMSATMKGNKNGTSNKGKKLGPLSDEHKAKLSEALKGKPLSDETRAKLSAAQRGQKHSDETKTKMSEARKGNKNALGFKRSEETKAKISAAFKGKKRGPYKKKEVSNDSLS